MVEEKNSKHAFWQALVVAIAIFGAGFAAGFLMENARSSEIGRILSNSEVSIFDEQVRSRLIGELRIDCRHSTNNSFVFADRIFKEAEKMEKYESASKFTNELLLLHRRYDLLRMMLWSESLKIKEECGGGFHTLIYFFNYNEDNPEVQAKQAFFSKLLIEIKGDNPEKILLIPIASNTGLESVNLALEKYEIRNIPSVLIDEREKIDEVLTKSEIEDRIFLKKNNTISQP